jgi:hypothetical protein
MTRSTNRQRLEADLRDRIKAEQVVVIAGAGFSINATQGNPVAS